MKTTLQRITRKTLLYKTGVEYGDYTANHVQGCSHGCKFPCYAFLMAKRFGKVHSYTEWVEPKLVCNALELLEREIPKYKHKIRSVHLCFSTDPFMFGYDEISDMSIQIINRLNNAYIPCIILTKGLLPLELTKLLPINQYGITLVSLDEDYREDTEPGAAPYRSRIAHLSDLHERGCKTWVSIEPYPTPNILNQDIRPILESVSFVDKIIFGRMNYNSTVTKYPGMHAFYNHMSQQVMDFCIKYGIGYHIKNGTITELSSTELAHKPPTHITKTVISH